MAVTPRGWVAVVGFDWAGSTAYLWSADLWFSAASGMKGDDHQYWEPLEFVDAMVEGAGADRAVFSLLSLAAGLLLAVWCVRACV